MITSKQRAKLRSQSNGLETIFQIGKGGISDMLVQQVNDALKAREMSRELFCITIRNTCIPDAHIMQAAREMRRAGRITAGTHFILV